MVSRKFKLRNGTRVLFAPMRGTQAVTVLILFPIGSRYETPAINGSSHFLEHLFFKGTERRPTTLDVSKELDGLGAEYNAFTGKSYTGYYVKVSADKLPQALDMLSDMLYHSRFEPKEIERERGVVVEEINMYEDNPMMLIDELFETLLFRGSTLAMSIAGPRRVIRTVTRRQLMAYKAKFYNPHNLLLTVAGKVNERQAAALVRRSFANDHGPRRRPPFQPFRLTQRVPAVLVKHRETEQVQVAFGFPGLSLFDRDLPALSILTTILGGNMSSRLFIRIRERQGLCYFIRAEADHYADTGTFLVRAGLEKTRLDEALRKIWDELRNVRDEGVTAEELQRAKDYVRGKLTLHLEDSENIADWVGKQQLLQGRVETPAEKIAKLRRVTASDVRRVAQRLIQKPRLNLALIGPYRTTANFRRLIQQLP